MREHLPEIGGGATEFGRHIRRQPDKIVGRKFGRVAKVLWPVKTAATIATIAKASERTAERWMAGEFEPPAIVLAAMLVEITRVE